MQRSNAARGAGILYVETISDECRMHNQRPMPPPAGEGSSTGSVGFDLRSMKPTVTAVLWRSGTPRMSRIA